MIPSILLAALCLAGYVAAVLYILHLDRKAGRR